MIATFEDFDRLYKAVSGHKVKCDRCSRPIYGTMLTGLSELYLNVTTLRTTK